MNYTELGNIAMECWKSIPLHFPHVEAPLWVVMPNHIHGIIIIHKLENATTVAVETQNFASLPENGGNHFGPQSKNLASIVRGFKIGVTKYARKKGIFFAWQSRFHDHIVRTQDELNRISEYIENNPARWALDTFNENRTNAIGTDTIDTDAIGTDAIGRDAINRVSTMINDKSL